MRRTIGSASTVILVLAAVFTAPLLSKAARFATSITITNNSSREIRHVYLSPANQDNWGDDQLTSGLAGGGSVTLNNVACSGTGVKVIAEDQDGCFMYRVVSCDQTTTWTIANDTTRDCGGSR
jgi:hypothetical protein